MMPLADNKHARTQGEIDKGWSFAKGSEAQRQLAHDLGYRKVPSVEKISSEMLAKLLYLEGRPMGRSNYDKILQLSQYIHDMLMEEKDGN